MKPYLLILSFVFLPAFASAEITTPKKTHEITMSVLDAVKMAGNLVEKGEFDNAEQILTNIPKMGNVALEIERWFLLGQISARRGDYDTAITIFRKILDDQPDLARIRFELAICYMKTWQWYRADYHLRLAMAGDDLPADVKNMMKYYRYVVRQNKNWNVWFNFGAAPDNNVNTATGGSECVNTVFGPMCRELDEPESAVGFNVVLGGNYELKFGEHWRWKSDANVYTNIYNKHKFDDLYLSASTGPRYVWQNGDMWLAGVTGRRWYGWDGYYWSVGGKIDVNYDFSRKFSGGLSLRAMDNKYDRFSKWLDGQTYSVGTRLSYSIDATKYLILRGGLERETANDDIYANWRPNVSFGFGAELPYGFQVYLEPTIYWTSYDAPRWVVEDGDFMQKTARDFTGRYAISLSNNNLDVWGFLPTITFAYTHRESNIWQREFDKVSIEFTMQQRF